MDTNDPVLHMLKLIGDLERRMTQLEGAHEKQDGEAATRQGKNFTLQEARFYALYDVVGELASQAGIPEDRLAEHITALVNYHRDRLLRIAENINPHWAAHIDNRGPEDDPAPDQPPSLFAS